MTDKMTLIERLQNPAWCNADTPFESPQLAKVQTIDDMAAAATEITRLRNLMQSMLDQLPIGATITLGDKVLDHTVLSLIRNEMRAALSPAKQE